MARKSLWKLTPTPEQSAAIREILKDGIIIPTTDDSIELEIYKKIDAKESLEVKLVEDLKDCLSTGKDPMQTSLSHLSRHRTNAPNLYLQMAHYIKRCKIDLHSSSTDYTPLTAAISTGHFQLIKFLIKNGASLEKTRTDGPLGHCWMSALLMTYFLDLGHTFSDIDSYHKDLLSERLNTVIPLQEIIYPHLNQTIPQPSLPPLKPPALYLLNGAVYENRLEVVQYCEQKGVDIGLFWEKYCTFHQPAYFTIAEQFSHTPFYQTVVQVNHLDMLKYLVIHAPDRSKTLIKICLENLLQPPPEIAYYANYYTRRGFFSLDIPPYQAPSLTILEKIHDWICQPHTLLDVVIPSPLLIEFSRLMHYALTLRKQGITPFEQIIKILDLHPLSPFATQYSLLKNVVDFKSTSPESDILEALAKDYCHYQNTTTHITGIHEHDNFRRLFYHQTLNLNPGSEILPILQVLMDYFTVPALLIISGYTGFSLLFITPGLVHITQALQSPAEKCLGCHTEFKNVSLFQPRKIDMEQPLVRHFPTSRFSSSPI